MFNDTKNVEETFIIEAVFKNLYFFQKICCMVLPRLAVLIPMIFDRIDKAIKLNYIWLSWVIFGATVKILSDLLILEPWL